MKNYKRYRAGKLVKKTRPKVRAMKIKKKKTKKQKTRTDPRVRREIKQDLVTPWIQGLW